MQSTKEYSPLTSSELKKCEAYLIKYIQYIYFSDILHTFAEIKKHILEKKFKMSWLNKSSNMSSRL